MQDSFYIISTLFAYDNITYGTYIVGDIEVTIGV